MAANGFPRPEIIWEKNHQVLYDIPRLEIEPFEGLMFIPDVLQSTTRLTIIDLRGSGSEANFGDELTTPLMLCVKEGK